MVDDIRGFYEANGTDYNLFLRRLMGREALVHKYLGLFLSDNTYSELAEAVEARDYHLILEKAHTLKGMALNIELVELGRLAAEIVSSIRNEDLQEVAPQFAKLQCEYERIVSALNS